MQSNFVLLNYYFIQNFTNFRRCRRRCGVIIILYGFEQYLSENQFDCLLNKSQSVSARESIL